MTKMAGGPTYSHTEGRAFGGSMTGPAVDPHSGIEARRSPRGTARPDEDGSLWTGAINAAGIEILAVLLVILFLWALP